MSLEAVPHISLNPWGGQLGSFLGPAGTDLCGWCMCLCSVSIWDWLRGQSQENFQPFVIVGWFKGDSAEQRKYKEMPICDCEFFRVPAPLSFAELCGSPHGDVGGLWAQQELDFCRLCSVQYLTSGSQECSKNGGKVSM